MALKKKKRGQSEYFFDYSLLFIVLFLMGFGLDRDAIHSPNESYGLDNFYRGIETITLFYKYFAQSK